MFRSDKRVAARRANGTRIILDVIETNTDIETIPDLILRSPRLNARVAPIRIPQGSDIGSRHVMQ